MPLTDAFSSISVCPEPFEEPTGNRAGGWSLVRLRAVEDNMQVQSPIHSDLVLFRKVPLTFCFDSLDQDSNAHYSL